MPTIYKCQNSEKLLGSHSFNRYLFIQALLYILFWMFYFGETTCLCINIAFSIVFSMWWEHTAISWPGWILSYSWTQTGWLVWDIWLQTYNVAQSLETWVFSLLVSSPVCSFCSLYVCLSGTARLRQSKSVKDSEKERNHICRKYRKALTCVSGDIILLLGYNTLTPSEPSSLWAACNSQCEFPNGHNGGQDHLLLPGGEVCIRLQLRRKTSWCL